MMIRIHSSDLWVAGNVKNVCSIRASALRRQVIMDDPEGYKYWNRSKGRLRCRRSRWYAL
jgi:hypothetical protein